MEGEYIFIKADVSLILAVDDVCKEIKSKEKAINVLFLTIGTLIFKKGMYSVASIYSDPLKTIGQSII